MPEDPDVLRLWTIAVISETFHVLPSVVAEDLDTDPEQLSLLCLPLLRYAEAKSAFDRHKDEKELDPWKGTKIMATVTRNTFQLRKERVAAQERARAAQEQVRAELS